MGVAVADLEFPRGYMADPAPPPAACDICVVRLKIYNYIEQLVINSAVMITNIVIIEWCKKIMSCYCVMEFLVHLIHST